MKKSFWIGLIASALIIGLLTVGGMARILDERPRTVMANVPGKLSVTLIIDPGHGGADGGAVSVTGTNESKINLDISLRAQAIAGLFGLRCVMTRTSEDIDYPESATTIHAKKVADTNARIELANSTENAVLISIHQNKYTTSGPSGSQVFYAPTQGSQELAQTIQETLKTLSEKNKRGAVQIDKSVYLMNHIECPAVLVECGFISNYAEAALLEDSGYQLKLAALIIGSCIAALD